MNKYLKLIGGADEKFFIPRRYICLVVPGAESVSSGPEKKEATQPARNEQIAVFKANWKSLEDNISKWEKSDNPNIKKLADDCKQARDSADLHSPDQAAIEGHLDKTTVDRYIADIGNILKTYSRMALSANINEPAEKEKTKEAAKAAYGKGNDLFHQKPPDYAAALPLFKEADSLYPGAAPKQKIALCLDHMSTENPKLVPQAIEAYQKFTVSFDKPADIAKYQDKIDEAKARIIILQTRDQSRTDFVAAVKADQKQANEAAPVNTQKPPAAEAPSPSGPTVESNPIKPADADAKAQDTKENVSEEAREQALQAFNEGKDLIKSNQFDAALKLFEKADQLMPGSQAKYNIAFCLENMAKNMEKDNETIQESSARFAVIGKAFNAYENFQTSCSAKFTSAHPDWMKKAEDFIKKYDIS